MASDSIVGEGLARSPYEELKIMYDKLLESYQKLSEDYDCLALESIDLQSKLIAKDN